MSRLLIVCCCCADVSGHVFWTFELDEYHRCMPKMVDGEIISFMLGPFNHMRFVTYCLLPFVVIMILNILIVARLRWTPQRVRHGLAGNRTPVSIGLDASSIVVATTVGGASCSTARMANTSASASTSAVALRQQQQARPLLIIVPFIPSFIHCLYQARPIAIIKNTKNT